MTTVDTFPMKWRVKRLDTDFEVLREYLLRAFPQTIIPPLPKATKKKLNVPTGTGIPATSQPSPCIP